MTEKLRKILESKEYMFSLLVVGLFCSLALGIIAGSTYVIGAFLMGMFCTRRDEKKIIEKLKHD